MPAIAVVAASTRAIPTVLPLRVRPMAVLLVMHPAGLVSSLDDGESEGGANPRESRKRLKTNRLTNGGWVAPRDAVRLSDARVRPRDGTAGPGHNRNGRPGGRPLAR